MRIRSYSERGIFRKAGGFWIDIQAAGKRIRERCPGTTLKEAKEYRDSLRLWAKNKRRGIIGDRPDAAAHSFDALADDFLKDRERHGKRSINKDRRSIRNLKEFIRDTPAKDIEIDLVNRYRDSRADKTPATRNREMACLRSILRHGIEKGVLESYPLPTRGFLEREPESCGRVFEPDEIRRIIEQSPRPYLRAAVIVWSRTGMRNRELMKLARRDADLDRTRTLRIIPENSKNKKGRIVPLDDEAIRALKSLPPSKDFFFENPETGKPIGTLLASFKTACRVAGVPGSVRIHDLRHSFITLCLREGIDPKTIADLVGDRVETILKIYVHSNPKMMRQGVERIAGVLNRGARKESTHKVHARPSEARPLPS